MRRRENKLAQTNGRHVEGTREDACEGKHYCDEVDHAHFGGPMLKNCVCKGVSNCGDQGISCGRTGVSRPSFGSPLRTGNSAKVIFVAFLTSVLFGEAVGIKWWLAALICTIGIFLPRRGVATETSPFRKAAKVKSCPIKNAAAATSGL